ncbi:hypothetical protein Btru_069265 [Bulinus truncatus]|nr:hypothetical protein Btru_069265 [Bulinus truncatus]
MPAEAGRYMRVSTEVNLDPKPKLLLTAAEAQYLSVDETKRPRANSDPVVGLHLHIVPEITVTGEDDQDTLSSEETDSYLIPPSPRRRANTCPEDMFLARKGRPPTPPPVDTHTLRGRAGKRFSFNFTTRDLNGGVSFAHHRLSKVAEDAVDSAAWEKRRDCSKLQNHSSSMQ